MGERREARRREGAARGPLTVRGGWCRQFGGALGGAWNWERRVEYLFSGEEGVAGLLYAEGGRRPGSRLELGRGVVGSGHDGLSEGSMMTVVRLGCRGRGAGFLVGVERTESEESFRLRL